MNARNSFSSSNAQTVDCAATLVSSALLLGAAMAVSPNTANALTDGPGLTCASTTEDALCTLTVVVPNSDEHFDFQAKARDIMPTQLGYHVSNTVSLKTPQGPVPITGVDMTFSLDNDPAQGLTGIQGTVSLPLPAVGMLEGASLSKPVSATLALDYGANLTGLGAHLNPDRHYLAFNAQEGLNGQIGPLQFSAPGGASATVVLDPTDPYFYVGGSGLTGGESFGLNVCQKSPEECAKAGEEYGFGFSLNGLIPFEADPGLPFFDVIQDLTGHLVLDGVIPLGSLPLSIVGTAVINLDPNKDTLTLLQRGKITAETGSPDVKTLLEQTLDMKLGARGTLDMSLPIIKGLDLGISLLDATVALQQTAQEKSLYFFGEQEAGSATLPYIRDYLPITNKNTMKVVGRYVVDAATATSPQSWLMALANPKEGGIGAYSTFTLDASKFGKLAGITMGDALNMDGALQIGKSGFTLNGTLTGNLPLPHVNFDSGASLSLTIPVDDPNNSRFKVGGNLQIAGVRLANGSVDMSRNGAVVDGQINAGLGKIQMRGGISDAGVNLTGSANVKIPFSVINQALAPKLAKAQTDVNNARADLNVVANQLAAARRVVQAERDKVAASFNNAQQAVNVAQQKVNSLQAQINSYYAQINQLNSDIAWWKNWYNNLAWYNKAWGWTRLGAEIGWRGMQIGALYTAIGGLEADKLTAMGALQLAKQALSGINTAILNFPVDADPRVAPLVIAYQAAENALQLALKALNLLPQAGDFQGGAAITINNNGLSGTVNGLYTMQPPGAPAPVIIGVSGRVVAEAQGLKACLDLPGAPGMCITM